MIQVFLGTDTEKARKAMSDAIGHFRSMHPRGLVSRFDADNADPHVITDALLSTSLFGDAALIIFDGMGETEESGEILLNMIPAAAQSVNMIYVIEKSPKIALRKALEEVAGKSAISEWKKVAQRDDGGSFAVADALQERDKRDLWRHIVKGLSEGRAPEEIHGTLWWAAKNLYIVKNCTPNEAKEAGVATYPYDKAKERAKKWENSEIVTVLDMLKDMVHDRGEGSGDVGLRLEKFALTIKDK